MATNAFDALVLDVNRKISEMNTAISEANGAASSARSAVSAAQNATKSANDAASAANEAANDANQESETWNNAQASATALAAGEAPTVSLTEENGAKKLAFGIPAGMKGVDGPKGDTGKSGVAFQLSGTSLYITTE